MLYTHVKQFGILVSGEHCINIAHEARFRDEHLSRRLDMLQRLCVGPHLVNEVRHRTGAACQ